jgi:hypothetical protein
MARLVALAMLAMRSCAGRVGRDETGRQRARGRRGEGIDPARRRQRDQQARNHTGGHFLRVVGIHMR